MFRWYGAVGLFMVLFAQVNFLFRLQPFAQWYFPIIWFGFIFLVDALVYHLNRESLLMNRRKAFLVMLGLSAVVWWLFEAIGWLLGNWHYSGMEGFGGWAEKMAFATISFATVIPAVFEVSMLLKTVHLFDRWKLKERHDINKELLYGMMFVGVLTFIGPVAFPQLFYPLIWISFFLILDPINYMNRRPSIISHLKDRRLAVPVSIFVGATVCGFLWEFWNFWAIPKWHYTIPFVDFLKVFEMPILCYIGYGPFGLELYAMYHFFMWLVHEKRASVKLFK